MGPANGKRVALIIPYRESIGGFPTWRDLTNGQGPVPFADINLEIGDRGGRIIKNAHRGDMICLRRNPHTGDQEQGG